MNDFSCRLFALFLDFIGIISEIHDVDERVKNGVTYIRRDVLLMDKNEDCVIIFEYNGPLTKLMGESFPSNCLKL